MNLVLTLDDDRDERIENLYFTTKLIRACDDFPIVWKLDLEYLDALCFYMHIVSHEELFLHKFLEAAVEATSKHSFCMGNLRSYDLIRN